MKTRSIAAVILLLLLTASASFARNDWFDKFSNNEDITLVTITRAMLDLLPSLVPGEINGINLKNVTSKLEQIDIFTSSKAETVQWMRKELASFFKNNKSYEVLMKIKDGDDDVTFHVQKEGDTIISLIMLVDEGSEHVIIRLLGKFTMADLQSVMGNKKE